MPGQFHGQRSLVTTVRWVTKSHPWLSTRAHAWDNMWAYCVQWDVPTWKSQYLLYMDIALHLQEAKEKSLHICCIQYTRICITAQRLSYVFIFFWNTRHTEKEVHQKISDFHYFQEKILRIQNFCLSFPIHPCDQSSLWSVTNSILLEKSNKLPWQGSWRSLWKVLQWEEQTVSVYTSPWTDVRRKKL